MGYKKTKGPETGPLFGPRERWLGRAIALGLVGDLHEARRGLAVADRHLDGVAAGELVRVDGGGRLPRASGEVRTLTSAATLAAATSSTVELSP